MYDIHKKRCVSYTPHNMSMHAVVLTNLHKKWLWFAISRFYGFSFFLNIIESLRIVETGLIAQEPRNATSEHVVVRVFTGEDVSS
jgi:hypothetical protein